MKKYLSILLLCWIALTGFAFTERFNPPLVEISDYGRQVAEDFLSQLPSLFSFGLRQNDGSYFYLGSASAGVQMEITDVRPYVSTASHTSGILYDRQDNRINHNPQFPDFGLVARDFRLFDLDGDGIPEILILWSFPVGKAGYAVRWTLHVYHNGTYHDSGRFFREKWVDLFYDYRGQILMTRVDEGSGFLPRVTYSYLEVAGGGFTTLPAGRIENHTAAQQHHLSPEFKVNPTRFDTGMSLVPIPHLKDLQWEITKSIRSWLYADDSAPSPLFRAAPQGVRIRIDGDFLYIPAYDQQPIIIDGRTMVPLRIVMEALGFTVEWRYEYQSAFIRKDDITIIIQIGNKNMEVQGYGIVELDVPARLIGGRTMVPMRAVAEASGMEAQWDSANRIVNITTGIPQTQTDFQPPRISDVNVEVLDFFRGAYRISISTTGYSVDPKATFFLFWETTCGIFDDAYEKDNGVVSFIFRADPGTGGDRNVYVIVRIEDVFGQIDRVSIALKGNDLG